MSQVALRCLGYKERKVGKVQQVCNQNFHALSVTPSNTPTVLWGWILSEWSRYWLGYPASGEHRYGVEHDHDFSSAVSQVFSGFKTRVNLPLRPLSFGHTPLLAPSNWNSIKISLQRNSWSRAGSLKVVFRVCSWWSSFMSQERLFSPSKPTTSDACIIPRSVSISVRLAYTCVLFCAAYCCDTTYSSCHASQDPLKRRDLRFVTRPMRYWRVWQAKIV